MKPLRFFVRIDGKGNVIPNSIVKRTQMPKTGRWIEINGNVCCSTIPSTTTSTTTTIAPPTTTTTTTTTTVAP